LRQTRRLADYVVLLYLGELVEHGPAQEFFSQSRNVREKHTSKEFLAEVNSARIAVSKSPFDGVH